MELCLFSFVKRTGLQIVINVSYKTRVPSFNWVEDCVQKTFIFVLNNKLKREIGSSCYCKINTLFNVLLQTNKMRNKLDYMFESRTFRLD